MPTELKPASSSLQKLMGLGSSLFRRRFNSSKCKTEANLVSARIKLLRNRREVQVRQMRRDIAMLLQSGQEDTARIRVEHVIREQNVMAANEIINLFCELIVIRLPIIQKQRDCPADLKEAISSVIYAAPRCSDIPELCRIQDIFEGKYGKGFASAATDLRPESGVNRTLIEKLSIRKPTGEVKLKIMKEIAKEYQIQWDSAETEQELLKPPEEVIEGPRTFMSAASFPVKPNYQPHKEQSEQQNPSGSEGSSMHFKDSASASWAAAESTKLAPAAQAAAHLPQQNSTESRTKSLHSTSSITDHNMINNEKIFIKSSSGGCRLNSDIKFDDSDGFESGKEEEEEEEEETAVESSPPLRRSHEPPFRPPPVPPVNSVPRVHPKLPDYDALAARFEALKSHKF
ncbi:hypothetical protein AXF42_Ash007054 [Apostasia shenzhenica]|uniref:IST1-like protein n=1 Tax=Apostasia shenzhenica TaxID=1088818 RepID=A0A2I0BEX7_9ASPA|nr:hypothetical protein AXF42_Ash007054 [Apostasia shenzhenica]